LIPSKKVFVIDTEQTMTSYQQQVEAYMTANHPDATVGDVLGKKIIQEKQNPVLFASLPYHLVVKAGEFTSIPDNLRHKVTFKVLRDQLDEYSGTALNYTASIPELAGKKITLSYSPATANDEAVIENYLPKPHPDGTPIQPEELPQTLPAYLINMKPELRIDGEVKATGTAVGLGQSETFTMQFIDPSRIGNEVITNDVTAGEYNALVIDALAISSKRLTDLKTRLETTKARLETEDYIDLTNDSLLGDLLFTNIATYFAEYDIMSEIGAKTESVIYHRLPSMGRFFFSLSVNKFFDIPRSVSGGGLEMDVDRSFYYSLDKAGNKVKTREFNLSVGIRSSALEHSVPEQLLYTPEDPVYGISAVKALAIANSQAIPIYQINKDNINTILPKLQLGGDDILDITNSVNTGKEVTVSQRPINFQGRSILGYFVINPEVGDGAYMISKGLGGGAIWSYIGALFGGLLTGLAGIYQNPDAMFGDLKRIANAKMLRFFGRYSAVMGVVNGVLQIITNPDLNWEQQFAQISILFIGAGTSYWVGGAIAALGGPFGILGAIVVSIILQVLLDVFTNQITKALALYLRENLRLCFYRRSKYEVI